MPYRLGREQHSPPVVTHLRLKELREAAGLNKTQLARLAGVNERTVRNIESGVYEPSLATARKLAAALDVSMDALLAGDLTKGA
jgi:DNA-binding XRE family transcriptional regulator